MTEREERLELAEWARATAPLFSAYAGKYERIAQILESAAQPEYLSGCQQRGPGECQKEGKCMSEACVHYNKTECRPRMMVLAQVDGILYPTKETK